MKLTKMQEQSIANEYRKVKEAHDRYRSEGNEHSFKLADAELTGMKKILCALGIGVANIDGKWIVQH